MDLDFSIIIPTYARPAQLTRCLEALEALEYPRDRFEVIVVDDGSPKPPPDYHGPLMMTRITQPNAGPAAARNSGAASARGHYLVFTDDDCAPAPDWLDKLAARFTARPDSMIGGRTINALPANPYAALSQFIVDTAYASYNPAPDQATFFASNHMAMPADRFRELRGFDPGFRTPGAEDRDFCDRWRLSGHTMTYAPEFILYHAHELTLASLWRQHFEYGRGAYRFHHKRARRGAGPFRPDPRFYWSLFRHPFTLGLGRRALLLGLLLVVQQLANAAGFFWEQATRGYE